jgi:hypothetical protein
MTLHVRTFTATKDIVCAACHKRIHPQDKAFILHLPPADTFTLCEQDGWAISQDPRPNDLLQYWGLHTSATPHQPPPAPVRLPPRWGELKRPVA